ncbi:hypothetical protein [Nostoc sphaeroides]|uniref:Uncharacterized protein n=1 Tax=Nostoc sphaeroides CCNUC1 TaxID=2653204 RepID=A0A5P8WJ61_9NOSO|nr:hypothetical protein GXM_09363 [Nostoc sphaeroides CCNUC1]
MGLPKTSTLVKAAESQLAILHNSRKRCIAQTIAFQGVHLRRDFANQEPVTTELWHLDAEDRRMIKVIIYLNDVRIEHELFEYIPKSQQRIMKITAMLTRIFSQNLCRLGALVTS